MLNAPATLVSPAAAPPRSAALSHARPRHEDPALWSVRLRALLAAQLELADKLLGCADGSGQLFDVIGRRHSLARDLQLSVRDYSRTRRRVFERLPADIQAAVRQDEARARTAVARALASVSGGAVHA